MPTARDVTASEAFDKVCEKLNSPNFERSVGAESSDIGFLSELLNNPILHGVFGVCNALDTPPMEAVSCDNIAILKELREHLSVLALKNNHARELNDIVNNPHFKALIESHDDVAAKNYEVIPPEALNSFTETPQNQSQVYTLASSTDAIRMVGIRKNPDEALPSCRWTCLEKLAYPQPQGITVRSEDAGLVIARIMAGSMIDRQGLLHEGDVIKEVNGQEVTTPDQLQEIMKKSNGNVTLKILPTLKDQNILSQVFLKAHFSFDPKRDNLIPCRDAGLAFNYGDILQVVNQDDAFWWQACKVDSPGLSGLIPSQQLEEKRKAFVRPEFDYTHKSLLCGIMTKKKKKMIYQSRINTDFDKTDLLIYEEVTRMPPFQRKTLVFVGAQGVGRRTLKNRLVKADPNRFGGVLPHTSRPMRPGEQNGAEYWFVTQDEMIRDVSENKFVEFGDLDGCFYGTKYETIRQCIRSGRMCVLDLSPQAAKAIKTPEFMPYIVFIGAPPVEIMRNMHEYARQRGKSDKVKTEQDFRTTLEESKKIERQYKQYFDFIIVNDNVDESYNKLRQAIEALSTEAQWVPVTWVY